MRRVIAIAIAGLLILPGAPAPSQEPYDDPDVSTVPRPRPPAQVAPTTTRDPRGDFSTAPTTSRFQRKVQPPAPAPAPQPEMTAPAIQIPAARAAAPSVAPTSRPRSQPTTSSSAAAPVTVASPSAGTTPEASDQPPAPVAVAPGPSVAATPAETGTGTPSPEAMTPLAAEPASGDQLPSNWLLILIAIAAGAVAASLAAAKFFMPWPRPRVDCAYQILSQPLGPGSMTLDAPDILIRGEALLGAPVLAGFAIERERSDND